MRSLEQSLNTAIDELRCLDLDRPASLSDLQALAITRECVDEILSTRLTELRGSSTTSPTWAEIAVVLKESSGDTARIRFGSAGSNRAPSAFWSAHSERFAWDFVPTRFVHALYERWIADEEPTARPLAPKALTRHLVTLVRDSDQWAHARLRTASLTHTPEPLLARVQWRPDPDGRAAWGFRRIR